MPQARIEFEWIADGRWVGEVEVGGLMAKRQRISAVSFDEAISKVMETYRTLSGGAVHSMDIGFKDDASRNAASSPSKACPKCGKVFERGLHFHVKACKGAEA